MEGKEDNVCGWLTEFEPVWIVGLYATFLGS